MGPTRKRGDRARFPNTSNLNDQTGTRAGKSHTLIGLPNCSTQLAGCKARYRQHAGEVPVAMRPNGTVDPKIRLSYAQFCMIVNPACVSEYPPLKLSRTKRSLPVNVSNADLCCSKVGLEKHSILLGVIR